MSYFIHVHVILYTYTCHYTLYIYMSLYFIHVHILLLFIAERLSARQIIVHRISQIVCMYVCVTLENAISSAQTANVCSRAPEMALLLLFSSCAWNHVCYLPWPSYFNRKIKIISEYKNVCNSLREALHCVYICLVLYMYMLR